jgi:DNA/RNA non-specific endonuclease
MSMDGGQRPPDPPRPPPPPETVEEPVGSRIWDAGADSFDNVSQAESARAQPDWNTRTDLPPNATIDAGCYQFGTDDLGRVVQATGTLESEPGQRQWADADRVREMIASDFRDQAGHLIAARFNGPGDNWNMVPQDQNLNVSEWKIMENEWARALEEGKSVHVDIALNYDGNDLRPWAFNIEYEISSPGGEVQTVQRDILNAPRAAHDEVNPG